MTSSSADQFLRNNYGMLRFVSLCAVIYGAIYLFYSLVVINTEVFDRYLEISATLGSWLVNLVTDFDTQIQRSNGLLTKIRNIDSTAYVVVARGCDASIVFAVLISTLSAWPGKWLHKLPAIILGLAIMFCLNIARIAGMSITESINPDYFDIMHEWILPSALVIGALIYFYIWTIFSGEHPEDYLLD